MKEALKKLNKKSNIEPILVGLGIFLILTFLIFPGLTVANTFINILSALGGIVIGLFLYYYLSADNILKEVIEEAGETELDYIPEEELKVKRKKTVVPKQTVKKVSKPLVEGKTKSQSKGNTGTTQAAPPPKPPKKK